MNGRNARRPARILPIVGTVAVVGGGALIFADGGAPGGRPETPNSQFLAVYVEELEVNATKQDGREWDVGDSY